MESRKSRRKVREVQVLKFFKCVVEIHDYCLRLKFPNDLWRASMKSWKQASALLLTLRTYVCMHEHGGAANLFTINASHAMVGKLSFFLHFFYYLSASLRPCSLSSYTTTFFLFSPPPHSLLLVRMRTWNAAFSRVKVICISATAVAAQIHTHTYIRICICIHSCQFLTGVTAALRHISLYLLRQITTLERKSSVVIWNVVSYYNSLGKTSALEMYEQFYFWRQTFFSPICWPGEFLFLLCTNSWHKLGKTSCDCREV